LLPSLEKDSPDKTNRAREQRAQKVVNNLGVKVHHFEPSGRELWTVVGAEGDALVDYDPSGKRQQYCSCDDFHFRVLGGAVSECYHLIAARKAIEGNHFSKILFSDEEYVGFLKSLLSDIFSRIS
jgi:predicted nucleic acid-binding Zn finger protein